MSALGLEEPSFNESLNRYANKSDEMNFIAKNKAENQHDVTVKVFFYSRRLRELEELLGHPSAMCRCRHSFESVKL
jgi:hypothetical protein